MRTKTILLLLLFMAIVASAQNPQTQTAWPAYAVNAKYAGGVAPGYAPTAGSGLNLALSPGTANCSGTIITYTGGTLALTASTTNYVYLNTASNCAPAVKTTAFVAADIPIAVITTSGSAITSIVDDRTFFNAPSSGISNTTITTGTSAINATCSSNTLSSGVTMTGLTTSNTLTFTPTSDLSSVTGWENGDIYFVPVLGSGSFQWRLCTSNASGETPGGSVTWNVSGK